MKTLSERLKDLGLSENKAADICHVSQRTMNRINNGRVDPRAVSLCKISIGLGIPIEELLEPYMEKVRHPAS